MRLGLLHVYRFQGNDVIDSDDNEDIADKLLARMEAKRIEEEKKAASKVSKAPDNVPRSKKNRQQIRKVTLRFSCVFRHHYFVIGS